MVFITISINNIFKSWVDQLLLASFPSLTMYACFYVVYRGLYEGQLSHWLYVTYSTLSHHPQLMAWGVLGSTLLTSLFVKVMLFPSPSPNGDVMRALIFLVVDAWVIHGMLACFDRGSAPEEVLSPNASLTRGQPWPTSALFLGFWLYGVCAFSAFGISYDFSTGSFLDIAYVLVQFILGVFVHLGEWGGIAFWMAAAHAQLLVVILTSILRRAFTYGTLNGHSFWELACKKVGRANTRIAGPLYHLS